MLLPDAALLVPSWGTRSCLLFVVWRVRHYSERSTLSMYLRLWQRLQSQHPLSSTSLDNNKDAVAGLLFDSFADEVRIA